MKKVTLTINTTGAAFEDCGRPSLEVARILRELANHFDAGCIPQGVRDNYGNTCGTCKVKG